MFLLKFTTYWALNGIKRKKQPTCYFLAWNRKSQTTTKTFLKVPLFATRWYHAPIYPIITNKYVYIHTHCIKPKKKRAFLQSSALDQFWKDQNFPVHLFFIFCTLFYVSRCSLLITHTHTLILVDNPNTKTYKPPKTQTHAHTLWL